MLRHLFDQEDLPGSVALEACVWRGSKRLQALRLVRFDLLSDENIPNLRVRTALLRVHNVRVVPRVGVLKLVVRVALVSVWHVVPAGRSKPPNHCTGVVELVLSLLIHVTLGWRSLL